MEKHIPLLAILFSFFFTLSYSQEVTELTGTIIYNDQCSNKTHPVSHAFDGDLNTYFMSCPTTGNWIGYDLGEKHIITKVSFAPRMDSDYRNRLQLGIFEGANNPDFGDAIALYIIPGLTERQINEQPIVSSRGFRYVRFVFPTPQEQGKSSYMSELKFFGYKGKGEDTHLPQLTNLPTISIHTVNNRDIVVKDEYIRGIFTIVYDNGAKVYTDSLSIRGRGNSSWTFPKKPYRVKLDNSTRLMNLPAKAKNWTLINNYGDKTLMRNMLAFDFSRKLELPYTSPAEGVDLVLNGDYKGSYQLSDHIDVRKARVNVEEMGENDLTGGYMLEIDAYAYPDEPKKFTSKNFNIPVTIKYPKNDDITDAQEKYIESHFNKWVSGVYNNNKDTINKYMDIDTFFKHFLVNEYSGNTDTYWSVRVIKYRDDDRFYFGPVWDFDLAFENDNRTYPINQKAEKSNQWLSLSSGSSSAGGANNIARNLLAQKEYESRIKQIYANYRDKNIINEAILLNVVDSLATHLEESQQLNFKRWQILNRYVHLNPVVYGSYAGEINNVKKYISGRINWLDSKLNYVPQSVKDNSEKQSIRVTSSKGSLSFSQVYSPHIISIYDVSGRILIHQKPIIGSEIIHLQSGIYFVQIYRDNLQIKTEKHLVQ